MSLIEGTKVEFIRRSITSKDNNMSNNYNTISSTKFPAVLKKDVISYTRSVDLASTDDYWRRPNSISFDIDDDIIKITVIDTANKQKKKYCCKRSILIQSMRYFHDLLHNHHLHTEIDLSMHCDICIFEWLLEFIHNHHNKPSTFDITNVLSIYISSIFLKMDLLNELCIPYIIQNLIEVLQQPIDSTCISDEITQNIASYCSPYILSTIKLKKNKLLQKIYKFRVKIDFLSCIEKNTLLSLCKHCGCLYLKKNHKHYRCNSEHSLLTICTNNVILRRHTPLGNFSIIKYIKMLISKYHITWEELYWYLWGAFITFGAPIVKKNNLSSSIEVSLFVSALQTGNYTMHKDGVFLHKK